MHKVKIVLNTDPDDLLLTKNRRAPISMTRKMVPPTPIPTPAPALSTEVEGPWFVRFSSGYNKE